MRILGKDAAYHKAVFEVRYEHGMVYLDRCGTTANRIMATYPEWVIRDDAVNPQSAPLTNALTGALFNFGTQKYDFSLSQPVGKDVALTRRDLATFSSQVEGVARIVHEELGLHHFLRLGFRIWFMFPTDSEQESNRWIRDLGVCSVTPEVSKAFGGQLESEGYVLLVNGADRRFRIAINAVERLEVLDLGVEALTALPRRLPKKQREALLEKLKAKQRVLSNPETGVMIDVDAYVEEPIEVDPADFITQSLSTIEEKLPRALCGGRA